MKAMNFEVYAHDSSRYGQCFYMAGLPDGRELAFHADRVEVIGGCLVASQVDDGHWDTTLTLAPGAWAHCYAASVIDGSPVCVERLAAPTAAGVDQ